MNRKLLFSCLALVLAVLAAYANHFQNQFHFDDSHTITGNPAIRDLRNIPRFFTDARLFSTMPSAATYRPVVSTTVALDYRLGRERPFFFHLTTFLWFCLQLILIFFLFRRLMDLADPHPSNFWAALFAAACYGLHPAGAETVNYIIQRGDLYDTLGVVASLLWFIARPSQRKYGFYLLPAVLAYFSKAPALIFPLILLAYLFLFEWESLRQAIPSFVVTIAAAILTAKMTPASYFPGAASASLYRLTQPWVALHYFRSFFVPTQLAVDSRWGYLAPLSLKALAGYLFVLAMLGAAAWAARRRETKPIAFGILWFFLALLPTSLMPLADVTNDHRMFFPFVGLALAVVWAGALWARLLIPARIPRWIAVPSIAGLAAVVLIAEGAGTWQRNRVWHTEESLWRDAVHKNPPDDRAMENYHRAFLVRGNYQKVMQDFDSRESAHPDDVELQLDIALANAILTRDAAAAQHFERAEALAPDQARLYFFYGRWLKERGQLAKSQSQLETAIRLNPGYQEARDLLEQVATAQKSAEAPPDQNALALLNQSARDCQNQRYPECLMAATQALRLRPGWVEAYNNLSVAFLAMQKWDEGIDAAQRALAIRPDDQTAKSNLQWAMEHRPR